MRLDRCPESNIQRGVGRIYEITQSGPIKNRRQKMVEIVRRIIKMKSLHYERGNDTKCRSGCQKWGRVDDDKEKKIILSPFVHE